MRRSILLALCLLSLSACTMHTERKADVVHEGQRYQHKTTTIQVDTWPICNGSCEPNN